MASTASQAAEQASLQQQQAQNSAEQAAVQQEKYVLQQKIERLSETKEKVKGIKDSIHSLDMGTLYMISYYAQNTFQVYTSWKGTQHNKFAELSEDFLTKEYRLYHKNVDDVLDQIHDEITRLKKQINEKDGLLGSLCSIGNSISNALAKLFN